MNAWWVVAIASLLASGVYGVFLAARSFRLVRNWMGRSFCALSASIALWCIGYACELLASDLAAKVLWAKVEYVGILSLPVAWFFLALAYTRRERWLRGTYVAGLSLLPMTILALVLTNQRHLLIWSRVDVTPLFGQLVLDVDYGAGFWISTAYAYALLLAGAAMMMQELLSGPRLFRRQRTILLCAALLPWVGNGTHLLDPDWLRGIDPSPFGFFASALLLAYGIHHLRLLEIAPLARRAVFEFMDEAAMVVDPGGRILDLNPSAQAMLGPQQESVIGKALETWFPEVREILAIPAGSTGALQIDFTVRGRETRQYEVALSPIRDTEERVMARLLILRDVTERATAAAALERSQRQFRELVDSIDGIVWEAQTSPERFRFVSKQAENILGYPVEKWINEPDFWVSHMHPGDQEWAPAFCTRMIAEDRAHEFEYRMIKADGATVWLRDIVAAPVPGGDLLRGIMVDITERKRLEERLRQAERLEAIGRLSAGIAHDFNNLLAVISGYAEYALRSVPADEPAHADLQEISKAAARAQTLTRQLLAFSHVKSHQPEIVDLNEIVSGMEQMLHGVIGADIEISTEQDPGPHTVEVDRGQIEQVIMNLVLNARDALPSGGQIRIRTRSESRRTQRARPDRSLDAGNVVILEISDNGVGMDERTLDHIFEPFFTTKEPGKGTGLGLATVYGIVSQAKGEIEVKSAPGQGSTFRVVLPAGDSPIAPQETVLETAHEGPDGQGTILLVEDEIALLRLAERILHDAGYNVLSAASGSDALRVVEAQTTEPIDLLLTDIAMPGMRGQELALEICRLRPGVRVLFVSGYHEPASENPVPGAAAVEFVAKPYSPELLLRTVKRLLRTPVSGH